MLVFIHNLGFSSIMAYKWVTLWTKWTNLVNNRYLLREKERERESRFSDWMSKHGTARNLNILFRVKSKIISLHSKYAILDIISNLNSYIILTYISIFYKQIIYCHFYFFHFHSFLSTSHVYNIHIITHIWYIKIIFIVYHFCFIYVCATKSNSHAYLINIFSFFSLSCTRRVLDLFGYA